MKFIHLCSEFFFTNSGLTIGCFFSKSHLGRYGDGGDSLPRGTRPCIKKQSEGYMNFFIYFFFDFTKITSGIQH
jgi:hypothetical protein